MDRSPSECHNFQSYAHIQNIVLTLRAMFKCGENHHTYECTKYRIITDKCTLCLIEPTANYNLCGNYNESKHIHGIYPQYFFLINL